MTCETLAIPAQMPNLEPPPPAGSIRSQVLGDHPEWAYLFDPSLPVRAATEAEQASYGLRATHPLWADLYQARDQIDTPITEEEATELLARCRDDWQACHPMAEEACHTLTSDTAMATRREAVHGPLNDWLTAPIPGRGEAA